MKCQLMAKKYDTSKCIKLMKHINSLGQKQMTKQSVFFILLNTWLMKRVP